jgi:uncharacterized protein (TIGR03067 family)
MTRFGFAFVLVLGLGATSARADDAADFKGSWKFTSVIAGGAEAPEEITKTLELKVAKDELELTGSAIKETIKSKYTLDAKAKTLDFEPTSGPEKGKVSKGIYDLKVVKTDKGDKVTLRLYFGKPGEDRPKKFDDPVAEGHFLWVLEKVK